MKQLSLNPRTKTFKHRETLSISEHYLLQIESGLVRTTTFHEDGTLITLGLWGTGDVVCAPLSLEMPHQVECLSNVQAHFLPCDQHIILSALATYLDRTQALLIIHNGTVRTRLRQFLAWFAQQFGLRSKEGYTIPFQPTHQDISEMVGSTRVTVTRLIKELEQKHLIRWSRGGYFVHSALISSVPLTRKLNVNGEA